MSFHKFKYQTKRIFPVDEDGEMDIVIKEQTKLQSFKKYVEQECYTERRVLTMMNCNPELIDNVINALELALNSSSASKLS